MKKSIIKYFTLGIGGLLSLPFIFGTSISNQFASKEESINSALAYEGTKLPTAGGTLASGTYYLDSNMTLDNYIRVATGSVVINLNGFSLSVPTNSNQTIIYVSGGSLTVNGDNGILTGGTGYHSDQIRGGAIHLASGNVTVNSCNFEKNKAKYGGAIYVGGGTITLNDCKLYNNEGKSDYGDYGSIFAEGYHSNANVIVNGGEIQSKDSGIMLAGWKDYTSSAQLNGVNIHDNTYYGVDVRGSNRGRAAISVSGNTIIKNNNKLGNLRLQGDTATTQPKVSVSSELGDNASIGITMTHQGVFTNSTETSYNDASKFSSDDGNYNVGKNSDGQLYLTTNYVVSFNMKGHGNPVDPQAVTSGSKVTRPSDPTAAGYTFGGWYKDEEYTTTWNFDSDTVTSNTTLYAKWEGIPYTITFNNDGGEGGPTSVEVYYDEAMPEIIPPTKEAVFFTGYWDSEDDTGTKYYNADGSSAHAWDKETDDTLYAHYDEPVAAISKDGQPTQYYIDFSEALTNWTDGTTLTLLKDVTMSNAVTISDTRKLDLNGYGINASEISSDTDYAILVNNGGNLTLNDSGDTTHYFIHERYKGYDAGLATTICDKATYDAASEDSRGTFEGGYLTGLSINKGALSQSGFFKIEENSSVTMNGGTIIGIYANYSSSCVCSNGTFIMNDGNMIYNVNSRGCINARSGILTINGGNISHNTDKSINNECRTGALWLNNIDNPTYTIRGGTITNNVATYGAINTQNDIAIEGNPVIKDNIGVGKDENSDAPMNIVLSVGKESKLNFVGEYTGSEPLGVSIEMDDVIDVTNSADVSFNNRNNVVSDNPNYAIGQYPSNHAKNGQLFYVKLEIMNVIDAIDNIEPLTYDGGKDDSLKDIITAIDGYNNLPQADKDFVDEINIDILNHDVTTYRNVDKVGDLIKAIPEAKPSKDYYDAVDLAKTEYDKLTSEEVTILNTTINFEQFLNDNIAAKKVVTEIEEIGEVSDDPASQEKIQKARSSYDSLSDEQKRLIAPEVLATLEEKESAYNALSNKGNATLIVLYIIFGILLLVGIIYFFFLVRKKKNNDDNDNCSNNDNKGAVRLASFTGLTPFIIYASQYLGAGYIILYVIIALTVIVWATDIAVLIYKKTHKNEKVVEEAKPQIEKEAEPVNEDEEETITITDEKGNIFNIRYIKSFTAKLIQSPEETKKYYEELKNYVLSYKKTTSRISWHYDSINSGRNQVLKFAIRGKTLCVYYPLNAEDYNDTKYKVEAVESKKFEEVPCLYRIKNDRRLGYAKDLIDTVMNNLGLVKGEEQHEVYSDFPYEENRPLIARGLIKEQKVQINKPVEEVVSKKVNDEGDEIITTRDNKGNLFEIRYIKSFTAKLSQASEEVKDYYNQLKNYALGYKKANSRISWHFDSINVGRNQVIKFSIRGKTLCVYYALNANDYLDTKYKVEAVESKKFEEVPCLYRIKNDRRRDYAKDLIDTVMANVPTIKGKESNEDFRIPYESTKALLAKGLIKENKVLVNKPVEDKPVEQMSEDEEEVITVTDEKGNIFKIRYIKSFTAKLIQSPDETKKYYEELKNYVLSYKKTTSRVSWHYDSINSGRNQVLKFAIRGKTLCVYYPLNAEDYNDTKYKVEAVESKKFEEVPCLYRIKNDRRLGYAKDLIDTVMNNLGLVKGEEQHEVYSNLPYEPNAPLIARGLIKELKVQVNKPVAPVVIKAEEVDVKMSDEEATSQIKEDSGSKKHIGKKGIVNIDVIAKSFANNEVVNIESLWEKKIISKNIGHVKVLARGSLDKKLNIELQDYSLQAVKMILLTGGTVKRIK